MFRVVSWLFFFFHLKLYFGWEASLRGAWPVCLSSQPLAVFSSFPGSQCTDGPCLCSPVYQLWPVVSILCFLFGNVCLLKVMKIIGLGLLLEALYLALQSPGMDLGERGVV